MAVTNATMIMWDSGSGKSSLLATLAEWGWKKHKKVSLLYSTDGGGFPSKLDALIRAGIIRVWKLNTRGEAFESCSRACQGFWPVEFTDPLAGETPPGVRLVPSIVTTYTLHCSKCDAGVLDRPNRRDFSNITQCPECSSRVNSKTGYVTEKTVVSKFFNDVGIVMFEQAHQRGARLLRYHVLAYDTLPQYLPSAPLEFHNRRRFLQPRPALVHYDLDQAVEVLLRLLRSGGRRLIPNVGAGH